MKRFDTFGEYMFDLLFAPLKKGKRAVNQFYIFFKVIGRGFDDVKAAFFRIREESNVVSCSAVMLPVHGQDRNMPRLAGEDTESYRRRLSMKGIISEWGGTRQGILYALTALGYEQSTIEPFVFHDPERWAEFVIHLKSSKQSGINNLDVIIAEVNKVKEGSSKLHEIQLEAAPMTTILHYGGLTASRSRTTLLEWQVDQSFTTTINIAGTFGVKSRTELPPTDY